MFVYIREGDKAKVLKNVERKRIPRTLVEIFDRENELYTQIEDDKVQDYNLGSIFLFSAETIK